MLRQRRKQGRNWGAEVKVEDKVRLVSQLWTDPDPHPPGPAVWSQLWVSGHTKQDDEAGVGGLGVGKGWGTGGHGVLGVLWAVSPLQVGQGMC